MNYMSRQADLIITTQEKEDGLVFIESERPRLFVSLKDGPNLSDDIQLALQEVISRSLNRIVTVVPLNVAGVDIPAPGPDVRFWAMIPCEEARVA